FFKLLFFIVKMFLTLSYIDFDIINYKKTTKNQYPLILLYKFLIKYLQI
ncbi:hypothetical protein HMPREF9108_01142, partial [Leptotrichia sp. oral taxon 225 str. F0581]